jgi:hypothetical protein
MVDFTAAGLLCIVSIHLARMIKQRGEDGHLHCYLRLSLKLNFQAEQPLLRQHRLPHSLADLCDQVPNKIQQMSVLCGGETLAAESPKRPNGSACALGDCKAPEEFAMEVTLPNKQKFSVDVMNFGLIHAIKIPKVVFKNSVVIHESTAI